MNREHQTKLGYLLLTLGCMAVVVVALFSGGYQVSWAAPGQSPNQQTVPPRPTSTSEPTTIPVPTTAPTPSTDSDSSEDDGDTGSGGGSVVTSPTQEDNNSIDDTEDSQSAAPSSSQQSEQSSSSDISTSDQAGNDNDGPVVEESFSLPEISEGEADEQDGVTGQGEAIEQWADLSLYLSVSNEAPSVDEIITFTTVVSNSGPNDVGNVVVEDTWIEGVTPLSSTTTMGQYDAGRGRWQIEALAVNQTITHHLFVQVNRVIDAQKTAEIIFATLGDPDSSVDNFLEAEDDQSTVQVVVHDDQMAALNLDDTAAVQNEGVVLSTSGVTGSTGSSFLNGFNALVWLIALLIGITLIFSGVMLVKRA